MVMAAESRPSQTQPSPETSYRYSAVISGVMLGAFGVYLWHQVTVPVNRMEAEVQLEHDLMFATRYYYETIVEWSASFGRARAYLILCWVFTQLNGRCLAIITAQNQAQHSAP